MIFSKKEREKIFTTIEGVEAFMHHATQAMLCLRGLEFLGASREQVDKMWNETYRELYESISKISVEDVIEMMDSEGDEKHE